MKPMHAKQSYLARSDSRAAHLEWSYRHGDAIGTATERRFVAVDGIVSLRAAAESGSQRRRDAVRAAAEHAGLAPLVQPVVICGDKPASDR